MSELPLRFLPTRGEVQLHAVRQIIMNSVHRNTCWIVSSPRFELPMSNQSSAANHPTAQPSYQAALPKNTQIRRPLDQVTCFKVRVVIADPLPQSILPSHNIIMVLLAVCRSMNGGPKNDLVIRQFLVFQPLILFLFQCGEKGHYANVVSGTELN